MVAANVFGQLAATDISTALAKHCCESGGRRVEQLQCHLVAKETIAT